MSKTARITKSFRIPDGDVTRRYTPGDVTTDAAHAEWAIENGYGEEIAAKPTKAPPSNKSQKAAPENKAAGK